MPVPRPVAGLPVVDPEQLAKAWLIALLERAPLAQAADVPAAAIAAGGPDLCAAVLAALGDDDALALLPGRAAGAAELAGADDAPEVLAAAEALRAVAMRALRDALGREQDAATLAAAADRLAHVAHVVATAALPSRPTAPPGEIHAHDRRESPAAVLARALERHAGGGEPFALLIGEVADLERWQAADAEALEHAAAGVTRALRPGDRLVQECPGRWWIVAPDTDGEAARALAATLAEAAEHAGPAGVAFGVAACPHDGVDAEALAAHADEALLSARAAGLPVA